MQAYIIPDLSIFLLSSFFIVNSKADKKVNKAAIKTNEMFVTLNSDKNIKVDFSYSGKLPEGMTVTISLPKEGNNYKEGAILYFYYYNPDTKEYEYVS